MDAAKAMWIFYEHPELKTMESVLPPNEFPKLREKARSAAFHLQVEPQVKFPDPSLFLTTKQD